MKMSQRNDLSVKEKCALLQQYDCIPKCSQREAALKLKISQTTLGRLLRNRTKYEVTLHEAEISNKNLDRKRKRDGKSEDVEEALLRWFTEARGMHAPISRSILMEKASTFAKHFGETNFKPTHGWLTRWQARNNIEPKRMHGEKQSDGVSAAYHWMTKMLPELLEKYEADDIYSADETGLYYRALPDKHIACKSTSKSNSSCKKQEERVTLLLCCNMTGSDKKDLLMIGTRKNPRCFRGVSLPVVYRSNPNAWMTSRIFTEFISEWDRQLSAKNKKIALLLDNCTAHLSLCTKNIEFVFLPSNISALIQPLDQGVVKRLKTLYRAEMRSRIIATIRSEDGNKSESVAEIEATKLTLLDCMHMLKKSWDSVSESTILNCYRKAGYIVSSRTIVGDEEIVDEMAVDKELRDWVEVDGNLLTAPVSPDDGIIEDIRSNRMLDEREDGKDENQKEGEETTLTLPTSRDVREALNILKRNLEFRGGNPHEFSRFYKVESDALARFNKNIGQITFDKLHS